MDEKALIAAARRGDTHSFNQLVSQYQDMVYNVAYRILGDDQAAADASQETFLSAYQAVGKFKGGSFKAWLLRIATNACYDQLRLRSGVPPVHWRRSTRTPTPHPTSSTAANRPRSMPCATNWARAYREA